MPRRKKSDDQKRRDRREKEIRKKKHEAETKEKDNATTSEETLTKSTNLQQYAFIDEEIERQRKWKLQSSQHQLKDSNDSSRTREINRRWKAIYRASLSD